MAQFFLSFFPPFLYFFLLFLFLFLSVIIFSFFSSPFTRHFSSSFSRAHVPPQLLLFICHLSSVICHCIPSVIKHLSFVICHHDSKPFTSRPLQSYSLHLPFLIVIIKPQNPTTFFFSNRYLIPLSQILTSLIFISTISKSSSFISYSLFLFFVKKNFHFFLLRYYTKPNFYHKNQFSTN